MFVVLEMYCCAGTVFLFWNCIVVLELYCCCGTVLLFWNCIVVLELYCCSGTVLLFWNCIAVVIYSMCYVPVNYYKILCKCIIREKPNNVELSIKLEENLTNWNSS